MLKALYKCLVDLADSLAEKACGTKKHLEGNKPRSCSKVESSRLVVGQPYPLGKGSKCKVLVTASNPASVLISER